MSEIEVENLRKRCRGPRGEDAPFTVEESENFGMVDPNNTGETTVEGANDPRPTAGSLCSEVRT